MSYYTTPLHLTCMRCKKEVFGDEVMCPDCDSDLQEMLVLLRKNGKNQEADEIEDFLKPNPDVGENFF